MKKFTIAYLFQIAREKSCDYVLIIYMKRYQIVYHNYLQFTIAYLFQIAREKSCHYVLIIYMKRCQIVYHNYAEAKRAHQVQK